MENGAERAEADGGEAAPASAEHTVQEKVRAVLAVLAGRSSSAREASALGVTEADVDRWKRQFVDAGSGSLLGRGPAAPPSIADLTARNAALRFELRRVNAEAGSWRRSAEGKCGPFILIEEIRRQRGIPVERFCALIGVSRRTYFRNLALLSARAELPSPHRARSRRR